MRCPHCNGSGEIKAHVGLMIMNKRKSKKLTQEVLSKRVGLSRTQITNIEVGRSDVTMKVLERFALALKCSPKELVP